MIIVNECSLTTKAYIPMPRNGRPAWTNHVFVLVNVIVHYRYITMAGGAHHKPRFTVQWTHNCTFESVLTYYSVAGV